MKKQTHIVISFLLTLYVGGLKCQTFQQLKPAANPAYILLGTSPTIIERPTTPKEFVASVQNAVVNKKMAPNFAMELNPWQMLPQNKNISYGEKVINTVFERGSLWNNLRNNFVLSTATSESDTVVVGTLKKGSCLAFGIKTILINGRPSEETYNALLGLNMTFDNETMFNDLFNLIDMLDENTTFDEARLTTFTTNVNTVHQDAENGNIALNNTERAFRIQHKTEILTSIVKDLNKEIDWQNDNEQTRRTKAINYLQTKRNAIIQKGNSLVNIVNRKFAFAREGFILDVNFAYLTHFEDNEWDAWHFAKVSAWTTLSYRLNLDNSLESVNLFDVMAIVRCTANDIRVDSSHYLEGGIKLQYTYNKLTLSGEFAGRVLNQQPVSVKTNYTYRTTVNFEYVFNNLVTLKIAIGRNFDGNSTTYDDPTGKIFAVGGLNFSILSGQ